MSVFEKHWKSVVVVVGILLLGGAGVAVQSAMSLSKEKKTQEQFFLVEKKYNDYKNKKNADLNPMQENKEAKKATPEELAQDLAAAKKDLETFIANNPKSTATQMASLYYSEILREEKNPTLALETLQKVQTNDKGLVNTLVQQQVGQLLADTDKCQEAIQVWQKIVDRKDAAFIHNDVKIQQALCYQKMNDLKKAEELLTNVSNQKTDSGSELAVKEAAKYLRLIQVKKVAGN